jgi:hypothetical protein
MIVIRAPRSRLRSTLLLAVLFLAASAWLTFSTIPRSPAHQRIARVVGVIGMPFFGIGVIAIALKMGPRLSLVLDREGMINQPSRIPVRRVPWDQITKVQVCSFDDQSFVGVDVRDPSIFADAGPLDPWRRSADAERSGFPINIPESMLDRSAQELADLILQYSKSPEERARLEVWAPGSTKS